ncbi:pyrimidine reductase family protein [Mycolicibacterium novocastrense]|uniref:Pyrimidine reductase family protein n=1 Tax=Mycolicibacterium novocastrense TaxID=59813 RepID=A0AAW5SK35_MYCNV|nr:pyrimidine reductase family protein [Mycolicibacterium novocastrense]GAT08076.1 riboflavin biosynthesis protein RibD [Mycolicibacterium novocastrense]
MSEELPLRAVSGLDELIDYYRAAPVGVRANMIFSADGAAAFAGRVGPLSDPTDQQLLVALRGFADVVLVGAATARAESYGPVKPSATAGRTARIAVVSRSGRLPDSLLADPAQRPILVTSARAVSEHGLDRDKRWELLIAGTDTVDVRAMVIELAQRGMGRVLCEGGPTLLDELVGADLVDEICVTLAPKLAGARLPGGGDGLLSAPTALRLDHVLNHRDYLYLKYSRR